MFTWTVSVVPHARSQSVRLSQGPIQRKLGLADIDVHTSSGPVTVSCPHLDAMDAQVFAVGQMDPPVPPVAGNCHPSLPRTNHLPLRLSTMN
ncbi:PH domain-containing protein, partial [Clavibacter michiganensis]